MTAPMIEQATAVRELAAFGRMYIDCLTFMAVRGHIEFPAAAEIASWRRRLALADEAAALLVPSGPALNTAANSLTPQQD